MYLQAHTSCLRTRSAYTFPRCMPASTAHAHMQSRTRRDRETQSPYRLATSSAGCNCDCGKPELLKENWMLAGCQDEGSALHSRRCKHSTEEGSPLCPLWVFLQESAAPAPAAPGRFDAQDADWEAFGMPNYSKLLGKAGRPAGAMER